MIFPCEHCITKLNNIIFLPLKIQKCANLDFFLQFLHFSPPEYNVYNGSNIAIEKGMCRMQRKLFFLLALLLLSGCSLLSSDKEEKYVPQNKTLKIALLLEGKKYDQGWDNQAYDGLKEIKRTMNAQTIYMQHVNTEQKQIAETKRLAEQGYGLIFGNGRSFEKVFNQLAPVYPNTHFVFFNGKSEVDNVSAINFTPESLGYFSGMVAATMTKSKKVGLIPAYSSMNEIAPFIRGVQDHNKKVKVMVRSVNSWNDGEKAVQIAQQMMEEGADILVPMGDGFNIDVIMEAHHKGRWAIGYISDQSFVSKDTVITSTVQNVSDVYVKVAMQHKEGTLPSGCVNYDFNNGGQDLAGFGPMVPPFVREQLEQKIKQYKTGELSLPLRIHSVKCR